MEFQSWLKGTMPQRLFIPTLVQDSLMLKSPRDSNRASVFQSMAFPSVEILLSGLRVSHEKKAKMHC